MWLCPCTVCVLDDCMVYILTWGTYSGSGWGSGKGWRMEQFVSCRKSQSWELLILDENMVARDYRPLMLPPEQVAELLPWYMQWSRDLVAEMHQRRLVRNEARRTVTLPFAYRPCDCATEWRCEPHGACFIHDSCFCPGSGSFPPVKPPRS